jgi:Domain of unknown function (DUF1772)
VIFIDLGLVTSSAFAGVALYINWSEQPARLALDDVSLLKAWKPSYAKGLEMQATLALVGGALGLAAAYFQHSSLAIVAGLFMLANWPYTLIVINPINRRIGATPDELGSLQTRALIVTWGRLHAVRTILGFGGVAAFFLAATTPS